MIKWCAYCQTWQGELPPLDSWELTHGICKACLERGAPEDVDALRAIGPVAEFFRSLRVQAKRGFSTPGAVVLEQASRLGIRPLELLIGLLQPALDEIGKLWQHGEVTIAAEHRFSAMVETVVTLVQQRALQQLREPPRPLDFLLVSAEGNHHTLGLRVVEAFLLSHGRRAIAFIPGLPVEEIVAQARVLNPRAIGISIANDGDLAAVKELATALAELPPESRPRLLVGGYPIRAGTRPAEALGVMACTDLDQLLAAG